MRKGRLGSWDWEASYLISTSTFPTSALHRLHVLSLHSLPQVCHIVFVPFQGRHPSMGPKPAQQPAP